MNYFLVVWSLLLYLIFFSLEEVYKFNFVDMKIGREICFMILSGIYIFFYVLFCYNVL